MVLDLKPEPGIEPGIPKPEATALEISNKMEEKYKKKEKGQYCFPNFLAQAMKKVSPRTQYEAEMLSIVFILIGLFAMAIISLFSSISLLVKIFILINAIAGFVLLSSRLVTAFQQYQSFLTVMGIIEEEGGQFKI